MYPVPDPLPVDLVREPRFGPLFLEAVDLNHRFESMGALLVASFVRMMVSPGLAGTYVQPCPRKNIELLATSF